MKEFSHPMNEEKREIDVGRLLENAITISRNEWKYVAEVELEVDPFLPPVRCRPGEINQVFLNLIVNAAQAIAEKYDGAEEKQGKIHVRAVGMNDFVEVRIEDNGIGIPESIRHRVFDPFFTTKEVGKGTGQGLSLVHSIVVKKHGGEVDLESKPGEGTTFIVRLPIVPRRGGGQRSPPTSTRPLKRKRNPNKERVMKPTVLIVDDDENILHGLSRTLFRQPYLLLTAKSGDEAQWICKTRSVDVIVSDDQMPGISGGELLAWVAELFPDVVRIMLTGNASASLAIRAPLMKDACIISSRSRATTCNSPLRSAKESRCAR